MSVAHGIQGAHVYQSAHASALDEFSSLRVFAEQNPTDAPSLPISISNGLSLAQATTFVKDLRVGGSKESIERFAVVLVQLYKDVFVGKDALRVEVWLTEGSDGEVVM